MSDTHNTFWAAIEEQIRELRSAQTADDVLRILDNGQGPDRGFFGGSGGDESVADALYAAGWELAWAESSIYYTMRAPDGSMITYIEGDIQRGDRHGNNPAQPAN
ncbi:hypothetical protein [Streptomyces sp. NRRL F-5053]|uniref:hypothetical protein n=1 Tax=Streptomyces sp. NRRL F-5053 TaxID=1463854 RepID=UPI0004CC29F0|nr:hypothetical protein [Streptomyces sp. NRRL F-5053]